MKKLIALFSALVLIAFAANTASAQYDASATSGASANIIAPISIAKQVDLAFGNIIASATAGTVEVDVTGTRTNGGGATFPTVPGTVTAAQFKATGFTGSAYSITLPLDNAISLTGTGTDMDLIDFTHNATEVLTGGEEVFEVGATLQVGADQTAGSYSGSFDVIVNYN